MRMLWLLLLVPLAAAGPQPQVLYVSEAGLAAGPPTGNGTTSWILPGDPFTATNASVGEFKGPLFIGMWPGSKLPFGNVTVEVWGNGTMIASTEWSIAEDPTQHDPMALLPPDPTDPEGAAFHIATQLSPYISDPPVLLDFGHVEANATNLEVRWSVTGGAYELKYDGQATPTFLYAPFWVPDTFQSGGEVPDNGQTPEPTPPATPPSGGINSGGVDEPQQERPESKDSPGPLLILPVLLVALRRR